MRGPPPAWMPPHPPDRDHDYENNYEDPEDCRERAAGLRFDVTLKGGFCADSESDYVRQRRRRRRQSRCLSELSSRDLLLTSTTAPPKYNSYEMSLSQQRRSAMREPLAPALDDWSSLAEGQTILHKNADGAYYIPSGSGE
ncbi:unnamed protein product [Haemonchus placei]|uniref:Teneurin N-terminal domain-containing protein n=1 Tax=Haemonchus placei TaxID=6290 RepID=A0A0N4VW42_HAEPC|nr:unnamed protein product [Haemonchus placei]